MKYPKKVVLEKDPDAIVKEMRSKMQDNIKGLQEKVETKGHKGGMYKLSRYAKKKQKGHEIDMVKLIISISVFFFVYFATPIGGFIDSFVLKKKIEWTIDYLKKQEEYQRILEKKNGKS